MRGNCGPSSGHLLLYENAEIHGVPLDDVQEVSKHAYRVYLQHF
jgi:hypothetical protein